MIYAFQIKDRIHTIHKTELWIENLDVLDGDQLAGYHAKVYPPDGTPPEVTEFLQMLLDDYSTTDPDPAGELLNYLDNEPQPIELRP